MNIALLFCLTCSSFFFYKLTFEFNPLKMNIIFNLFFLFIFFKHSIIFYIFFTNKKSYILFFFLFFDLTEKNRNCYNQTKIKL